MVFRQNPVYGLLFLLLSFVGAAGVFYALSATFVALSQILVYAGAISVLFLFVLMFIDLRRKGDNVLAPRVDSLSVYEPASVQETQVVEENPYDFKLSAALVSFTLFGFMTFVVVNLPSDFQKPFSELPEVFNEFGLRRYFGSMKEFGGVMLGFFPFHFQLVGFIILVGVMGAVILAKNISGAKSESVDTKK